MTAPTTISDLTVSTPVNSYGMVLLQFTAPSSFGTGGASTMDINHSVADAGSWVDSLANQGIRDPVGQTMPGTATSCRFMITDLTPDTNYDFRIRATNQNSEAGAWSSTATAPAGNGFLANSLPQGRGAGGNVGGARAGVYDPSDITIIKVTSTAEDGAGTLQEAAETAGPRIIIFKIAGRTFLDTSKIRIRTPYCTVLGQTSYENGGGGFYTSGQPFLIQTHQVVVAHMQFMLGDTATDFDDINDWPAGANTEGPGIDPSGEDRVVARFIYYRCLMAWGADSNIDLWLYWDYPTMPNLISADITLQQCIMTDCFDTEPTTPGPGTNAKNNMFGRSHKCSAIFNLYANAEDRSPRWNSVPGRADCIGNGQAFGAEAQLQQPEDTGTDTFLNYFSNYAASLNPDTDYMLLVGTPGDVSHEIYVGDKDAAQGSTANLGGLRTSDTEDEWDDIVTPSGADGFQTETMHTLVGIPIGSGSTVTGPPPSRAEAQDIYINYAGPFVLNETAQFAKDVFNGIETGRILLTEPGPFPVPQTFTPDVDTNDDGIPNSFELAKGFGIETMSPVGFDLSEIYTNIEMWAFELVNEQPPAAQPPQSVTVTSTITITNTRTVNI